MNARVMEPPAIHEFIFGDPALHARFSIAIEMLARIVIANPRPVRTAALAETLQQSPRSVRALLAMLNESGVLRRHDDDQEAWSCSSALNSITLADVFRCVSETHPRKRKGDAPPVDEERSTAQQSVDLLLMQATMSINQVVLQQLQSFDLGRLKAIGSASAFHTFASGRHRAYIAEPI